MLEGVQIHSLKQFHDERGKVMHMLRNDDPHFQSFGEIYFSCVNPGAVKAWHLHSHMALNYAVPFGEIKLVIYDPRPNSPTKGRVQEIIMGDSHYCLVTIPPGTWSGFSGLANGISIVANCSTIPHDPKEITRAEIVNPHIPYTWK